MSELVPNAARITAASASVADHYAAFRAWMASDSLWWDVETSSNVTLLSAKGTRTEQILLDVSGSTIIGRLDPDGGYVSAAAPGAGSAAVSTQWTALANLTYSARSHVIETPDMLTWIVQDPTNAFWLYGFHAGIIFDPFNRNDPSIGITGHGVLAGAPRGSGASPGLFWFSTNSQQSRIRNGPAAWSDGCRDVATGTNGATLEGRLRMPPITIRGGLSLNTAWLGTTRYLRQRAANGLARSVIPSSDSDQGWMTVHDGTGNAQMAIIWDKAATI
jgi:hypothetical protein